MKRRFIALMLVILTIFTGLVGCNSKSLESANKELEEKLTDKNNQITTLEEKVRELEAQLSAINQGSNRMALRVIDVIGAIKNKDMEKLSSFTHPEKGLRFSPYGNIEVKTSKAFTSEELKKLSESSEVYTWGNFDGTGDPINMNFNDYYKRFVYDKDFANPHVIGNNTTVSYGNSVNNINDVYPNGYFIELHFKGFDPKHTGMDWESLKLVFEEKDGEWYLVAIVHDEWTI